MTQPPAEELPPHRPVPLQRLLDRDEATQPHTPAAERTAGSGWWLPTPPQALELMRHEGAGPAVCSHVATVLRLGEIVCAQLQKAQVPIDSRVVLAGCVLHDLGRSVRHDLWHGIVGSERLAALGAHPALVLAVRRHIGSGITAQEAVANGLPDESFVPQSLEEEVVSHVDNLVGGDRYRPAAAAAALFDRKGLHASAQRLREVHLRLSTLAGVDLDDLLPPNAPAGGLASAPSGAM